MGYLDAGINEYIHTMAMSYVMERLGFVRSLQLQGFAKFLNISLPKLSYIKTGKLIKPDDFEIKLCEYYRIDFDVWNGLVEEAEALLMRSDTEDIDINLEIFAKIIKKLYPKDGKLGTIE